MITILRPAMLETAVQQALFPRYLMIQDFLAPEDAASFLDLAANRQSEFAPATIYRNGATAVISEVRSSLTYTGKLGRLRTLLETALRTRFEELCEATGIAPFVIDEIEIEIAVHLDGGRYGPHRDVGIGADRLGSDRILTLVWYFNRTPRRYEGGELALYPLRGDSDPILIRPEHNLAVAFPAMALHEVHPTRLDSDGFGDGRFAINCWLTRRREIARSQAT